MSISHAVNGCAALAAFSVLLLFVSVSETFAADRGNGAAIGFVQPMPWDESRREEAVLAAIRSRESRVDPETGMVWGTHGAPKGYHSNFERGTRVRGTRGAMDFAFYLLMSPKAEHRARGCALLERVLDIQDRDPNSRTFGVWSWYYEEPLDRMYAVDFNWADFQGATLVVLLNRCADRLPPPLLEKSKAALEYACRAIIKRDVPPTYTNIAMMGATVTAAAGELLGRPDFTEYGRNRIKRNLDHYRNTGGFAEYNSPTYTITVLDELERMLFFVRDPECRETAESLRREVWKTIAEHWHPPTAQWAGPHSRAYADTFTGAARERILFCAGVLPPEVPPPTPIFVPRYPCPESLRPLFLRVSDNGKPVERHHAFVPPRNRPHFEEEGTVWMNDLAALGSVSYHSFWNQCRGTIAYWVSGSTLDIAGERPRAVPLTALKTVPAVLRIRFLRDGDDFASAWGRQVQTGPRILTAFGFLRNCGSMHPSFDRPKDAVFPTESFEIVYQLAAADAEVRERDGGRFELSSGQVRAVVHPASDARFEGHPIEWQAVQEKGVAKVVGTLYCGERRPFAMRELGETRIAVGLELLHGGEAFSTEPIVFGATAEKSKRDGDFYTVGWKPAGGEDLLTVPLHATDR